MDTETIGYFLANVSQDIDELYVHWRISAGGTLSLYHKKSGSASMDGKENRRSSSQYL